MVSFHLEFEGPKGTSKEREESSEIKLSFLLLFYTLSVSVIVRESSEEYVSVPGEAMAAVEGEERREREGGENLSSLSFE